MALQRRMMTKNTLPFLFPMGSQTLRSPNIVKVIKSRRLIWAGHIARMEEDRCVFKILTGKPTGNRLLGRARRRWGGQY